MTTKLLLVMLLSVAAFMLPAKAQFNFGCFMKAGQTMMQCSMKCKMNFACFERCGSDAFQAVSNCNKPPAPPLPSLIRMAAEPDPSAEAVEATATVASSSDENSIEGSLHFLQSFTYDAEKTYIQGRITGLAPGKMHGLHIHFNSSCGDTQNRNGAWYLGLGNVAADASGMAKFSIAKTSLTLVGGPRSVLGQALVVHPQPDDMGNRGSEDEEYGTETTGKYCTERVLACGIIQFAKA